MIDLVNRRLGEITALCREFGVATLYVFGSATTEAFDPERSDVDLLVERGDFRNGAAIFDLLRHDVMRVRRRGDLRKMRDAQHLSLGGDLFHLLAHRIRRFAADVGVHFVEHEHGDFVLSRQHSLQCQHHPRHFAGGRDGPQRFHRFGPQQA